MINFDKYGVVSKPLISLGNLIWSKDWKKLKEQISNQKNELDYDIKWLERALVLSEDHRFYEHKGIDISSILRAIWRYLSVRKIEGASTITQQLVRVLTGKYERSLQRKFKEIVLACMLEQFLCKKKIIDCYLNNAYFGWRMNGVKQAISRLNIASPITPVSASRIVARLKYPEPQYPNILKSKKILQRELHIQNLIEISLKNGI